METIIKAIAVIYVIVCMLPYEFVLRQKDMLEYRKYKYRRKRGK